MELSKEAALVVMFPGDEIDDPGKRWRV